jgi:hypothetical protein
MAAVLALCPVVCMVWQYMQCNNCKRTSWMVTGAMPECTVRAFPGPIRSTCLTAAGWPCHQVSTARGNSQLHLSSYVQYYITAQCFRTNPLLQVHSPPPQPDSQHSWHTSADGNTRLPEPVPRKLQDVWHELMLLCAANQGLCRHCTQVQAELPAQPQPVVCTCRHGRATGKHIVYIVCTCTPRTVRFRG